MENRNPTAHFRVPRWYFFALGIIVGAIVSFNVAAVLLGDLAGSSVVQTRVEHISPAFRIFVLILGALCLIGVAIDIRFFLGKTILLHKAVPRIQPQILLLSFIFGIVCNILAGGIFAVLLLLGGVEPHADVEIAAHLGAQIAAAVVGLICAMGLLRFLTFYTREDFREIGWRWCNVARQFAWGAGGYCGALPPVLLSLAVVQRFGRLFFREWSMPEHPIIRELLGGRFAFVAAILLAVVVAPIVEETLFRGLLYTALRGIMGFWGAAATSAAVFAAVHPTIPVGFLPLFVLGMVLAVVRQSTGCLAPAMICHAINNAVALALVWLVSTS